MKKPVRFSQELFDTICGEIASGRSLRSICKDEGMPTVAGVMKWLNEMPDIVEQYARAREIQAETLFDEIQDIADDGSNDWMERFDKDGNSLGWHLNGEHVQRSRLRIDARKWQLSKMIPKKYGERMDVTSNGNTIAVAPIKWADE